MKLRLADTLFLLKVVSRIFAPKRTMSEAAKQAPPAEEVKDKKDAKKEELVRAGHL